ncbi:MAG: efflux RND transporter periplasmic adaptor subunit [Candidatus Aminicenantes bacterium]|nr:efflux RND transporter periplasmic adaptor subunit [Candidatus Aminicenantes bacterium]
MNRVNRVIVTLLTISFSMSLLFLPACKKEQKAETTSVKQPIKVKIVQVGQGEFIKRMNYKGTVLPWKQANIGPDVSGRIDKIYKKEGDVVTAGTLLAQLDTTTMELQKKQVEAALGVAVAAYKDAQLNFERIKKLFEKNAVSQMQYEKTQLALEAADTQKKSAEANLDVIQHTLNFSYMKAPFNGIITSKNHEEGDTINPMMGMSAGVLTLMDLSKVKIVIDVQAEDIEKIKINQECLVKISSLPDEQFTGKVYSRNLAADPLSKTFKVEVMVENPGMKINAGVFADVEVETLKKANVLYVPPSAVVNNEYAVLYENGKARRVKVTLGEQNEQFVEVTSGLQAGQSVVSEGNYDLKDGAPITPIEEK